MCNKTNMCNIQIKAPFRNLQPIEPYNISNAALNDIFFFSNYFEQQYTDFGNTNIFYFFNEILVNLLTKRMPVSVTLHIATFINTCYISSTQISGAENIKSDIAYIINMNLFHLLFYVEMIFPISSPKSEKKVFFKLKRKIFNVFLIMGIFPRKFEKVIGDFEEILLLSETQEKPRLSHFGNNRVYFDLMNKQFKLKYNRLLKEFNNHYYQEIKTSPNFLSNNKIYKLRFSANFKPET